MNKACSASNSISLNCSVDRDTRQGKTSTSFKPNQKFGGYNSTTMIETAKDKRTVEERLEVIQVEHVMDSKRYGGSGKGDGNWEDAEDLKSRARFGPKGYRGLRKFSSEPQINSELINTITRCQIDTSVEKTTQEKVKFDQKHTFSSSDTTTHTTINRDILKSLVLAKIEREKSKNLDWKLNKPELVSLAAEISSKFSVLHGLVTPANNAGSFIHLVEGVVKDYHGISRKISNERKLFSPNTGNPLIAVIDCEKSNAESKKSYENHTRSMLLDISNSKSLMKSFTDYKSKVEQQKTVITILMAEKFALDHKILEFKAKLNKTRRNSKINSYLNDLRNRGSFQKMIGAHVQDSKIFWQQNFASFLEWNFGLQFAHPRGIWVIRQITAGIFRGLANLRCHVKINLSCNFGNFLEWNLGLEFLDPRRIWRIKQITAEIS